MASSQQHALEQARLMEDEVLRHGDIDAMVDLGRLLLENDHFVSQRARGVQMLERAIKQAQHPLAMTLLGVELLRSGTDKEEHLRAFQLFERSLKLKEDVIAANQLGYCYFSGKGVSKDHHAAVQLFERALRLLPENPILMKNLAVSLLKAQGLHTQKERAIRLFKKAIHLTSDADMMNDLGCFYYDGDENLTRCPKRASKWFRRAIRTSKFPGSLRNLAYLLLENDPTTEDVEHAVQLLEDLMELEQGNNESTTLKLADTYLYHGIDSERALLLYETAAIRFDSQRAMFTLLDWWLGYLNVEIDYGRVLTFCWDHSMKNKNKSCFFFFVLMTWTGSPIRGTKYIQMNRKRAIKVSLRFMSFKNHCFFSLMLRRDLISFPGGEEKARRLMKKFDKNIDRSKLTILEAIILSENDCEQDKALAIEIFQSQRANNAFPTWIGPNLRVGCCKLPFDGRLDCVTNTLRRFAPWKDITSLNLASILLETKGKQQEALAVLENLMNSDLKLIAMLNLAHVLMNDFEGVPKDRARGMQLLEDAVKETNDVSARTMLASGLSEGQGSSEDAVARGWKLWQSVKNEVEDGEELRKLQRLISQSSGEKWRALEYQRQVEKENESALSRKEDGL